MDTNNNDVPTYDGLRKSAAERYRWVSSNTRTGWINVKLPPVNVREDVDNKTIYMFEVGYTSVSSQSVNQKDLDEDPTNVLNLQYFFIRIDRELHKKLAAGENPLFILVIRINGQNYNADIGRVASYLFLQAAMRNRIKIYIRKDRSTYVNELFGNIIGLGRIPPLLCVAKQEKNGLNKIKEADQFLSYKQVAETEALTEELIQQCINLYYNAVLDEQTKKTKSSFTKINEETSFTSFQKIAANYLLKVFDKISGTKENKVSAETKKSLIRLFCENITKRFETQYTPLSQLIWLAMASYIAEEGLLLDWNSQNKTWEIRTDILDKCSVDAREYAEGLLQLIENSCQHTQNGIAYFSMRIHYVNRRCIESDLLTVAENRKKLIHRFSCNLGNAEDPNYSWLPNRISIDDEAPYYIEFQVVDDATFENEDTVCMHGIPYMFKKNRGLQEKDNIKLYHVFGRKLPKEITISDEDEERKIHNVIYHYGVRQLQKIVLRNKGYFVVRTPGIKENTTEIYSASYTDKKHKRAVVNQEGILLSNGKGLLIQGQGWQQIEYQGEWNHPISSYQIILPIAKEDTFAWNNKPNATTSAIDLQGIKDEIGYTPAEMFSFSFITEGEGAGAFKHFTLTSDNDSFVDKTRTVDALEEELKNHQEKAYSDFSHTIFQIDLSSIFGERLEFASKAIFQRIARKFNEKGESENKRKRQLYALFFSRIECAQEFLLDYSVFYDENGISEYMDNVQIAICITCSGHLPEVNFILTGTRINAAWSTINSFAHHSYSSNTVEMLSHLRYLCNDTSGEEPQDEKPVPPFPFDLYLGGEQVGIDGSNVSIAPANDCWFLRQLAELVERDIRRAPFGCKIENIHVRLGSGLHIEDFYEAELLFQDVNIVTKLAYLIVQDILYDNPTIQDPILIVGYETYSSLLLEFITQFLKECNIAAYSAVYGYFREDKESIVPSAALREKKNSSGGKEKIVTIYPIGTTMSTVYKMLDCVETTYKNQYAPWKNYCVLVVENKDEKAKNNYWSLPAQSMGMTALNEREHSQIKLLPNGSGSLGTKVRYYLRVKTVWHEADNCTDQSLQGEKVLTHVDSTSTVPNLIFPLIHRKVDGPQRFAKKLKNEKRLEALRDCVSYGHICVGNNHFMYHLDLSLYFEHVKNGYSTDHEENDFENEMKDWAKTIDSNAYNIIVAPLQIENTAFVQTIIEKVFAHCIRVVRIPFLDARKEDIRSKYSFIGHEYEQVKQINPNINIHFYYVTMGIVTGQEFYRASKLMKMLVEDSIDVSEYIFKGVFTLVNRSSWSTIKTMVKNPETDFHAFLHLSVPHFNTYQGICPGCVNKRRTEKTMYYCSTNELGAIFARQRDKLELRTPEKHNEWITKELWNSSQGFSSLCLWMYQYATEKSKKGKTDQLPALYGDKQNEKNADLAIIACKKLIDSSKEESIVLKNHKDFLKDDEITVLENLWIELMKKKAFLRLVCTHNAYVELESKKLLDCNPENLEKDTIRCVINLLLSKATKLDPNEGIEWIISYIKVLSRDYLSKHHYIRQSVFSIMAVMLQVLLGRQLRSISIISDEHKRELKKIMDICKKATPLQQYQLMVILFRQLASMQANVILQDDTISDFIRRYYELQKEQKKKTSDDDSLCIFPTKKDMQMDIICGIKICLLSGDEEDNSLQLQELIERI